MSRRRNPDVGHAFGKVRLLCPTDHVVGYVVRQRGRTYLVEPDGHTARPIALDGKLRFRCEQCAQNRRTPDLQGSGPKLHQLLDTLKGTADYHLGG